MIGPLSRTALRSRWAVQRLARAADELQAPDVVACRRLGDGGVAGRDVPLRVMGLGRLMVGRRNIVIGLSLWPIQSQALDRLTTIGFLLPIAGEILARICTKILREIHADFLRGSRRSILDALPLDRMPIGRRLPFRT